MMKLIDDSTRRTRHRKQKAFTKDIFTLQRKPRTEMILKAISAEPGCSQSKIAEYAKISSGTVARDVAALERRTLVTVVRSKERFKPHQHWLSEAGERYVKNIK